MVLRVHKDGTTIEAVKDALLLHSGVALGAMIHITPNTTFREIYESDDDFQDFIFEIVQLAILVGRMHNAGEVKHFTQEDVQRVSVDSIFLGHVLDTLMDMKKDELIRYRQEALQMAFSENPQIIKS